MIPSHLSHRCDKSIAEHDSISTSGERLFVVTCISVSLCGLCVDLLSHTIYWLNVGFFYCLGFVFVFFTFSIKKHPPKSMWHSVCSQ